MPGAGVTCPALALASRLPQDLAIDATTLAIVAPRSRSAALLAAGEWHGQPGGRGLEGRGGGCGEGCQEAGRGTGNAAQEQLLWGGGHHQGRAVSGAGVQGGSVYLVPTGEGVWFLQAASRHVHFLSASCTTGWGPPAVVGYRSGHMRRLQRCCAQLTACPCQAAAAHLGAVQLHAYTLLLVERF